MIYAFVLFVGLAAGALSGVPPRANRKTKDYCKFDRAIGGLNSHLRDQ